MSCFNGKSKAEETAELRACGLTAQDVARIEKLEADNAAKDARIKELERQAKTTTGPQRLVLNS